MTVAGNWQAAASTVIYPLCSIAKSEAHIAEYLSLDSTTLIAWFLGRLSILLFIKFAIFYYSGKRMRTLKNSELIP